MSDTKERDDFDFDFDFDAFYNRVVKSWHDKWAAYRIKYPTPTDCEMSYMYKFVYIYPFERDDFVEDDKSRSLQHKLRVPNPRTYLIRHLHQIRHSKGYDVEDYVPSLSPFIPSSSAEGKKLEHQYKAEGAAWVAMSSINHQTSRELGRKFELVRIDKYVWTTCHLCFLLTLIVKEVDVDSDTLMVDVEGQDEDVLTIRAVVSYQFRDIYELHQWKFHHTN